MMMIIHREISESMVNEGIQQKREVESTSTWKSVLEYFSSIKSNFTPNHFGSSTLPSS